MFFDRLPGAGYVCAHRGARALAPENTLLAAKRCVELGADFWEMDVHKVADDSLVVFHDDVLTRTSNVVDHPEFADRKPWPTHAFTLEELRQLDIGSWFIENDPYGTIVSGDVSSEQLEMMPGQRILTLREALEFTSKHSLPMNIEIKEQKQAPGDLSIVGDILREIRATETESLILISSFNHDYLAEMRRLAPEMPIAALVEKSHPDNIVAYLRELGAMGYHPDKDIIHTNMVRTLADQGIRVTPFTVNDMDQALSLIDAGCFGITTDYTHSLRRLLVERERRKS